MFLAHFDECSLASLSTQLLFVRIVAIGTNRKSLATLF